jgi:hypothetical protein
MELVIVAECTCCAFGCVFDFDSVSAWKNSALALFVDVDRGLEESSQDCMDKPDGLMKAAADSEVILRERDGFWQFISTPR